MHSDSSSTNWDGTRSLSHATTRSVPPSRLLATAHDPPTQSLSISPGDPVTCDLLKLVLDDTANSISAGTFPFPGLPPLTLVNIDDQVAALDADIVAGRLVVPEELQEKTEEEIHVDDVDESVAGETMDMSG
mgnify:FL=1